MCVYGPIPALLETFLLVYYIWEEQCHSLVILLAAKKILEMDEVHDNML
jgi:hypothetical protein